MKYSSASPTKRISGEPGVRWSEFRPEEEEEEEEEEGGRVETCSSPAFVAFLPARFLRSLCVSSLARGAGPSRASTTDLRGLVARSRASRRVKMRRAKWPRISLKEGGGEEERVEVVEVEFFFFFYLGRLDIFSLSRSPLHASASPLTLPQRRVQKRRHVDVHVIE